MSDRSTPPPDPEDTAQAPQTEYVERVRAILSGTLLVGFIVTILAIILLQTFAFDPSGLPTVETVGSLYSGITGAILGYYFGKGR